VSSARHAGIGASPGIWRVGRVAVAAVLGAVVVISAVIIRLQLSGSPHGGSAQPGTIAWVDRPAPEYHPSPIPRPVFPGGPRCGASALRFVETQKGAATGNELDRITFRNVSSRACEVRGYPELFAIDADGTARPLPAHHGSFFPTPGPVAAAAPRQVVAVNISGGICARRPAYREIRVVLPTGAHVDVPAPYFARCGLDVGRFGVLSLAKVIRRARNPTSPLLVSAMAPHTFQASGTMRYRISVTNSRDKAYPLRPCPSYQEYLVVIIRGGQPVYVQPNYYLNCTAVSSIPAHGTVLFAMEIRVPAGVGEAKFGWVLNVPGTPGTGSMVQVVPASSSP
jgi:hypothetical protein